MKPFISVIVTTYNWPELLSVVLQSLLVQTSTHFEIIIADDGSTHETTSLIKHLTSQSPISIKHAFHEDRGFRAGTIRNKAAALSEGEYLIFLDGDCSAPKYFIERHAELAEKGFFVPGNRILLTKNFTPHVLTQHDPIHSKSLLKLLHLWLTQKINRITPLLYNPFRSLRYARPTQWQKAMTCNLGLFKDDFLAVNGFDEAFEGWGYEDSDLVIRLIHNQIKRKEGRFAVPVFHHWHKQNDQSKHDQNYQRLQSRIANKSLIKAEKGINQYL